MMAAVTKEELATATATGTEEELMLAAGQNKSQQQLW